MRKLLLIVVITILDVAVLLAGLAIWALSPCGFNIEPKPESCSNNSAISLALFALIEIIMIIIAVLFTRQMWNNRRK